MFDPEFFPTPRPLIEQMLTKVSSDAKYFLDPSAGKGDIADVLKARDRWGSRQVDCIEIHPELIATLQGKGHTVVGTDWLTYSGVSYYDVILMNPPYSNGDEHLLKAWEFLYAGEIVCLLNAETLLNPYTERRQRLMALIEAHGDVDYLGPVFQQAERPTEVNVAQVYLKKVGEDDRLDLWKEETPERPVDDSIGADPQWLAIRDTLGNKQHYYDQANAHMFKAFQHLRKAALYLQANDLYVSGYDQLVHLALAHVGHARAEFARKHRKEAWRSVLTMMDFHKWLDKQQQEAMIRDIERDATIPFTKDNIKGTLETIWVQRRKLFEISVAHVFDELTKYHAENRHYPEGWKTNDNFKVNKRIVFPYGCRYEKDWGFEGLYAGSTIDIYNDLDRVVSVLDGQDFAQCYTIGAALERAFEREKTRRRQGLSFDNATESAYFEIRFYKKGTVHLKWKSDPLWEGFNKTAAAGKRWLGMQTQTSPKSPRASEDAMPEEAPEDRMVMVLPQDPPVTDLLPAFVAQPSLFE